jgi:hypothetical protein
MFKFKKREITKDDAIEIIFACYKENIIDKEDDELLHSMIVCEGPIQNWSDKEIQEFLTDVEEEEAENEL